MYVLEAYLGKAFNFTVFSQGAPDLGGRPFSSFKDAGFESGNSRTFGGVHFNKSNVDGFNLGYAIARHIHLKKFGGSVPLA